MRALLLLILALGLASCVDADEGADNTTVTVEEPELPATSRAATDVHDMSALADRSVAYSSGERWDGWEDSPQRVKVRVRVDADADRERTHYFESLPVARGWLAERYDDYDLLDLRVASATNWRELIDGRRAYYAWDPGGRDRLPVAWAFPSRRDAETYLVTVQDAGRYDIVEWQRLDTGLSRWRTQYWSDWRDDFGFTRPLYVQHLDGAYWDGWRDSPDRVLVRALIESREREFYFDSLPVALGFLNDNFADYDLRDVLIASALGDDLLDARRASFIWGPSSDDTPPAVLAFPSRTAAERYLRGLNDDDFRLAGWSSLSPHLTAWYDDDWDDWRSDPERGVLSALAVAGAATLLEDAFGGVVAGDTRTRERGVSDIARDNHGQHVAAEARSKDKSRAARAEKDAAKAEKRAAAQDKARSRSDKQAAKAQGKGNRDSKAQGRAGKSKDRSGKVKGDRRERKASGRGDGNQDKTRGKHSGERGGGKKAKQRGRADDNPGRSSRGGGDRGGKERGGGKSKGGGGGKGKGGGGKDKG
jgi:hypothetical protein